MRLCVALPCHFPTGTTEEVCTAIRKVAAMGYDAVEAYGWNGWDLHAIRSVLDETGVELLSLLVPETRLTDPACRSLWLEALRTACEAAAIVGAKKLITQVGNDTGAPREVQHAAIVETLSLPTAFLNLFLYGSSVNASLASTPLTLLTCVAVSLAWTVVYNLLGTRLLNTCDVY